MNSETIFRLIGAVGMLTTMSVSGYFKLKTRQEGTPIPIFDTQGLVKWLRLVVLFLWAPIFAWMINPEWVRALQLTLPDWVRWLGALLMFTSVGLILWCFRHLRDNVTATEAPHLNTAVVSSGPYQIVRHPLYVAGFVMLTGLFLLSALWWALFSVIGLILFMIWFAPREEAKLVEAFGDAYRDYARRTGRFLPRQSIS